MKKIEEANLMDKIPAQSMQPIKLSQIKSVYANTNILGKLHYFTNLNSSAMNGDDFP